MYNDEMLSPENYELMAREYSKSLKKNIRFVEVKIDKTEYEKICNNIFIYANVVENYFNCLINIKSINKNKLEQIKEIKKSFNEYKKFIKELGSFQDKDKIIRTNYCECLTKIISNFLASIRELEELKSYCETDLVNQLTNNIILLTKIIDKLCSMFGTCQYRR